MNLSEQSEDKELLSVANAKDNIQNLLYNISTKYNEFIGT